MHHLLPFPALLPVRRSGGEVTILLPPSPLPDPATALQRWRQEGVLVKDEHASFYALEVQGSRRERAEPVRYLVAALAPGEAPSLEENPDAPPPLSPLPVLAADDHHVLRSLLAEATARSSPQRTLHAEGRRARLWRLDEPRLLRRTQQALDGMPIRALGPSGRERARLGAVVPLSDSGLIIRPIHRGLSSVPTFREETFLTLVQEWARVYDVESSLGRQEGRQEAVERLAALAAGYHALLLVLPGGRGKLLRFRQALDLAHVKAAPKSPTLRSLDLALLNSLIFRTVLGLKEPEVPGHAQVFPVATLEELIDRVEDGRFQAGFALNPPPLWEIRAVMEAQQRLPSRTLRIEPFPPVGLLFLDAEP